MDYQEFLAGKIITDQPTGFDVPIESFNPMLRKDQVAIAKWGLRRGRAAYFLDCGYGKGPIQLECLAQIGKHFQKAPLLVAPIAVVDQFVRTEGPKFGYQIKKVADQEEAAKAWDNRESDSIIIATNYERIERFDPAFFGAVSLDESSILANYTGKTKQYILESFKNCRFRFSNSATPAPNNHLELGNHAEFLGVMPSNEMISRWFINDTMAAGNYRIKKHAAFDFWRWVASWAVCASKPTDIGFPCDGFDMPPLEVSEIIVPVDQTIGREEGELLRKVEMSSTSMHKELRITAPTRAAKVAELVNGSEERWIVWCNTDYEADELVALIPDAIEVRGSHSDKKKADGLNAFTDGLTRVIITKPSLGGMGLNWQHCHNVAFVGLSYSFKDLYQALRRSYRYGQLNKVNAYIILAETEHAILDCVKAKIQRYNEMATEMVRAAMLTHELSPLKLRENYEYKVRRGQNWELHLGDSCEVIRTIPSDSIHYSIFSPPFANLYIYSDSLRDMGNCLNSEHFFAHFGFIARELLRIIIPGRLCSIHCKDLPLYKGRDGAAGLDDFPGQIIRCMEEAGWTFHSRVTIWKDPVIEMQRTKNHGLLYKELCKDSSCSRQGMADYLITFRKWTDDCIFPAPVRRTEEIIAEEEGEDKLFTVAKERFDDYCGAQVPVKKGLAQSGRPHDGLSARAFSIEVWQRYASPVWFDILQTEVLNKSLARAEDDERHICPLQFGVVERAVDLWTNPGDTVFTPFAGIGTEVVKPLDMGRKGIGIELKEEYWQIACRNCQESESAQSQDLLAGLL